MSAGSRRASPRPRKANGNGFPAGILVDNQIRRARKAHLIEITPFDEGFLEPATYDLRVGDHAAVTTAAGPIDLRDAKLLVIGGGDILLFRQAE